MKREYTSKMTFIHSLQPWAHTIILQRNEILKTYQEMMKVTKCMEKNSYFARTMTAKEGHPTSGFKGDKKNKWEKVPRKGKKIP
jgi:hypothetical protein